MIVLNIVVFLLAFAGMEFVAWFTHKYVMHGFLWVLHKDHHVPHKGRFEKNDLFVVFFATPAVVSMVIGINTGNWTVIAAGAGITLYGICYTLFHDVMFHKRLRWLKIPTRAAYLKRIINAHRNHHSSTEQERAKAFGFLFASKKYEVKTSKGE